MAHVATEPAWVFRAHAEGRRYFTRNAAYRGAAKAMVREKCECEPGSYAERSPEYTCLYHDHETEYGLRVIDRLARFLRFRDECSQKQRSIKEEDK